MEKRILFFFISTLAAGPMAFAFDVEQEKLAFFERRIRPILVDNCYVCHSEHHKEAGGVRVDDYRSLTNLRDNRQAIVPGDATASHLYQRITHADDAKTMPPDRRLNEQEIADIKQWINDGAVWPPTIVPDDINQTLDTNTIYENTKKSHWAWQPFSTIAVPKLDASSQLATWPRNEVDAFIAEKLDANGLKPVSDANKSDLLRRVYFDLTGLPPSKPDVQSFLSDNSSNAFEKVVDKLLASEAFGERWGRHWLDVARYGESTGSARNLPYPHAWRYRDYVVDAFNSDKPYNQFLQEQLAGDLLPADSLRKKREQLVATGFLALGVKDVNQRFQVRYDMDNVDEQIDTVSRAVLGLTVSCARCHDHKFDPVSTCDYYALAGIFTSTELCDSLRNQMGGGGLAYYVPERLLLLDSNAETELTEQQEQAIQEKQKAFQAARAEFLKVRDSVKEEDKTPEHTKLLQKARRQMQDKQAELVAAKDPAKLGPVALGVRDRKSPSDTEIRLRGEAEKYGPTVPRGFLSVLDHVPTMDIPADRSGRYELSIWLTHPDNPLTSRVIVNRIWQHLFGRGIVSTVDNFGITGDSPSHPELLDFLATKFVQDGWKIKDLIRYLVLSRSYQLSSTQDDRSFAVDPSNKLNWRHTPRRLEAEELRDAILVLSGQLQQHRPESTPSHELAVKEIRDNGPEAAALREYSNKSRHRSLYLPLVRGIVPGLLSAFDFAEQGMVTGQRTNTTVPTQALFMLNDSFVRHNSNALAQQMTNLSSGTDEKVVKLFQTLLGREPSDDEVSSSREFLESYTETFSELSRSTNPEAFKLVSTQVSPTRPDGSENGAKNPLSPVTVADDEDATSDVPPGELEVENISEPTTAAFAALIHSIFSCGEFRYLR